MQYNSAVKQNRTLTGRQTERHTHRQTNRLLYNPAAHAQRVNYQVFMVDTYSSKFVPHPFSVSVTTA